jgi:hypothetical protein
VEDFNDVAADITFVDAVLFGHIGSFEVVDVIRPHRLGAAHHGYEINHFQGDFASAFSTSRWRYSRR